MMMTCTARQIRLITIMGAGLLIGTALIIIIPEGIDMWYSASVEAPPVHDHDHGDNHEGHAHGGHSWVVGATLSAGFAFMMIIDQLSGGHPHAEQAPSARAPANIPTVHLELDNEEHLHRESKRKISPRSRSAVIGLIIHAAVDGVALGAAPFAGGASVELLVFVAIMMHKAPAAFGLTTFLLHGGLGISAGK